MYHARPFECTSPVPGHRRWCCPPREAGKGSMLGRLLIIYQQYNLAIVTAGLFFLPPVQQLCCLGV